MTEGQWLEAEHRWFLLGSFGQAGEGGSSMDKVSEMGTYIIEEGS
jgi:hypothetical protein